MTVKAIRIKNKIILSPEKDREVKLMIIILAVFAAMMIIGAGCAEFAEEENNLNNIIEYWLSMKIECSFMQIFLNSLIINLSLLFIIFVSGFSCVGIPSAMLVPIFKGVGTGFIAAYLINSYFVKGIGYYLLSILPSNIISVSCLLTACNYSVFLSNDIASSLAGKKQNDNKIIKNYICKFIILFMIIVFSALIETILSKTFFYFLGAT